MESTGSFHIPWSELGRVPVSSLFDARLQLHWAVQIVASFGNTLIGRQADDSQSNLRWVEALTALCGHPSPDGFSVGLRGSRLHTAVSGLTSDRYFRVSTNTLYVTTGI